MSVDIWFVAAGIAALVGLTAGPVAASVFSRRLALGLRERMNERLAELDRAVRSLEARLERYEQAAGQPAGQTAPKNSPQPRIARTTSWPVMPVGRRASSQTRADNATLIAIPSLPAAPSERQAAASELEERYATIWSLEAQGASADLIARTAGLPIGQVELILGLRRQIDGRRNSNPHASHG